MTADLLLCAGLPLTITAISICWSSSESTYASAVLSHMNIHPAASTCSARAGQGACCRTQCSVAAPAITTTALDSQLLCELAQRL